jgi:anti-sigma factor RsiW
MNEITTQPCPDWATLLHGLVDGELDHPTAVAVESHLETCAVCATALSKVQAAKRQIHKGSVRWAAPDTLRAAIISAVGYEHAHVPERMPPRNVVSGTSVFAWFWQILGRWGAAPSLVALAAVMVLSFNSAQDNGLQDEVLASHIRSMLANHLVDVQTSDRHTVRPWFNGKVDFSPPVVDLAEQGFPLVGGRIDYIGGQVVAALVYRRDKHVINLFVWPDPDPVQSPQTSTLDGYSFAKWSAGGLTFWSVSDASTTEQKDFRRFFTAETGF